MPHKAFENPLAAPDAPARQRLEMRVLARFAARSAGASTAALAGTLPTVVRLPDRSVTMPSTHAAP